MAVQEGERVAPLADRAAMLQPLTVKRLQRCCAAGSEVADCGLSGCCAPPERGLSAVPCPSFSVPSNEVTHAGSWWPESAGLLALASPNGGCSSERC